MNNRIGFVMVGVLITSLPALAAAEPPNLSQCAEAFEKAQALNKQGKPTPALDQLLICAQPSCPAFLTKECTANYDRIKSSLPTVTLIARRSEAEPLVDVKVSVDGNVLQTRIDGLAVALDPGLHEFVFEHEGDPPVTVRALLAEGERNKPIIAIFPTPPAPQQAPQEARGPAPAPQKATTGGSSSFHVPAATYAFGALGVAGVGLGVTFRVLGAADYNSLADTCGRRCANRDVDQAKQKYLVSNISLGLGAAALVTSGLFLYFSQSHDAHSASNPEGLRVGAGLVQVSAPGALVSGTF
jgi:hypothetical protein